MAQEKLNVCLCSGTHVRHGSYLNCIRAYLGPHQMQSNDDEDEEEDGGKQVVVGICAMAKKSESKPMREILTRLQEFQYIRVHVFPEEVIVEKPVEEWPSCDCLISFHSKGFPLEKAIQYSTLTQPYVINNLHMQYDIQDRRKVYSILESQGIEIPRYAVLDRDSTDPTHHELIESEDHVEVNGVVFNKPFVEKPVSAEDHNIYIYYPTSAGGGSQRLFRKIGSRSSVYSPESRVRKTGSFIYEDFMPTDGTDVKVYTVGPDYAHAEARKSPALDGKVERDSEGKEIRYPVILSNAEKLISRKVCLAFKQTVCGFDLLRANGKSFVCDVNGFSFVKNSNKYYDDCAKILGNMILRELAPTLHIPWSVPFQLDDPPIVPTTFGKMMELRCVVAVIRHGDRTPKQKMKVEVRHPKFFEIFEKYGGRTDGHVKLKRPKQLQEVLDIARYLLTEIEHRAAPELAEKQAKLEQLKSVLEMYGHFSGINRKVQMKYQPKGRPKSSSSDDDGPREPSLVLIVKWGGELTPAGRIQAEELGRVFRCMYPGGQGRHYTGEYAGTQGLGLLRLHSTYRHDLKIYASDEGRVQMTAAAFAKGLLALEGELTPILVQMVKSANTNGLLDNDSDASKHQDVAKTRLHALMQQDHDFTKEERSLINPCNAISINLALDFVKNPVKCCERVHALIQKLMNIVRLKKDDPKTKDATLYHGETWELMGRRWGKIEKDFCLKNRTFDISKIPDIYDCIKYDLQHNQHTLQFDQAEELYIHAKYLADIVIPQEYGMTPSEKLTIGQGICIPLLKKIRADLQRNIEENEENVNRLNPRYSHGVSSPGRHVRTRLYFTSESHIHSLLTVLRYGGLISDPKDEQWRRAMDYVSMVSELNYMSQVVILLYEDPTKDPNTEERFHVELHFSPGVNCCVQKNLPPGPGFRPHSRNDRPTTRPSSSDNSPSESPGPSSPVTAKKPASQPVQTSEPIPIKQQASADEWDESVKSLKSRGSPAASQEQRSRSYDHWSRSIQPPARLNSERAGNLSVSLPPGGRWVNTSATAKREEGQLIALDLAHVIVHGRRNVSSGNGGAGGRLSLPTWGHPMSEYRFSGTRRSRTSVTSGIQFPLGRNSSTSSVFSTAVISGAASAPNLTDIVPNTASLSEGCGGVPPIRPLETLHNALSLRQLDLFLDKVTRPLKTPASSPPKCPSTPQACSPNSSNLSVKSEKFEFCLERFTAREVKPTEGGGGTFSYSTSSFTLSNHSPYGHSSTNTSAEAPNSSKRNQQSSPQSLVVLPAILHRKCMGWSDPPSFVSSSGASSPAPLPDFFLANSFRVQSGNSTSYFEHRDSIEVAELYSRAVDNAHFAPISDEIVPGDSGEVTPVSEASEEDFCSETLLQESDTTVVPTDTVRAKLSDICWDNERLEEKKAGRFVCTSVSEPTAAWARMEESPGSFKSWRDIETKNKEILLDEGAPTVTVASEETPTTTIGFHIRKEK